MAVFYNHKYRLTLNLPGPILTGTDSVIRPGSDLVTDSKTVIEDLQIKGSIKNDKSSESNVMVLSIHNLSQDTIDKVSQEELIVKLEVAYPDEAFKVLFSGGLLSISTTNKGSGPITTIKASDGYSKLRGAETNRTWSQSPVTAKFIIETIITEDMGLALGDIHNQVNRTGITNLTTSLGEVVNLSTGEGLDTPFSTYSAVGQSSKVLDGICEGLELEWNITNESVNVYPKGSGRRKKELIPLFSPTTGLLEAPSKVIINGDRSKSSSDKKTGKRFKVILSPTLLPGDSVKIESKNINEEVVVKSITHNFNYYKGAWHSMIVSEDTA